LFLRCQCEPNSWLSVAASSVQTSKLLLISYLFFCSKEYLFTKLKDKMVVFNARGHGVSLKARSARFIVLLTEAAEASRVKRTRAAGKRR
jgi:hypothetical protein